MSDMTAIQEYWDRQPCCSRHSQNKPGTVEYYRDLTAKRYFVQPHIRTFADFPRWSGKQVLEIGCGAGTDAEEFAREGADYTGIELSPASLNLTINRFHVMGLKGSFYQGDAEQLSLILPQRQYDLIYAFGVLHHTPHPAVVLNYARQYLKPTGELRIMLYARHSWKSAMIDAGLDQFEAQDNCPLAYRYTNEQVCEMMKDAGFKIASLHQDHIFPYQVEPYKTGHYVKQPWFEAMPTDVFRALEASLGWHLLIRAIPTPTAIDWSPPSDYYE
jgi:SAM-dependent methyltransferase